MGTEEMKTKYYQDEDGNHFFRESAKNVLHVLCATKRVEHEQQSGRTTYLSTTEVGNTLINLLDQLPRGNKNLIEIDQETFDTTVRNALLNLDIHEFLVAKTI
jgi:hypothetical protein